MIVNTGRGALVDTAAVIDGLKSGRIGSLALDVYEEEGSLFFEDRSAHALKGVPGKWRLYRAAGF